ncbi:MAG: KEOPS complex N(6)-L-threonylcarbamoyladenine synthase Kae1 [Nitrososphaeraceae archaeon]|jgi:N6-L-threonylcarbamoyladenine synthase
MLCLGIESTAHTFGCSVLEFSSDRGNIGRVLSDVRDSYKAPEGTGIHPREASRHHAETSPSTLKQSLEKAKILIEDVDVIAYSAGPGLGPCLRIGAVVARTLATFYKKPLVPVNHALGHVELGSMLTGASDPLVLLVSGGHTMIIAFSGNRWRVFGETLDITIGQLLDQFGRSLGFASPCGSRIEQLANQSSGSYLHLPYVVKGNDVCLSGLLTSALRLASDKNNVLPDLCYSLQETAFAMITETIERAMSFSGKKETMVVGGVAANKRLAEMLESACNRFDGNLFVCPIKYAGDNGAQIAWTGILDYVISKKQISIEKSFIRQSWRIDTIDVGWRK